MSIEYQDQEKIEIPIGLLEELVEIAFDYINPEGTSQHGIPLVSKKTALNRANHACDILDNTQPEV